MKIKTVISLVVVACLILLLLRQIHLRQLTAALLHVRTDILAIGLAMQLAVMWLKSIRWSLTIHAATGHPVRHAFSASMIGFAGNVLLPARLGELARIRVIDKHNQIGRTLALTTVGLTQLTDFLILFGYFLTASVWATSPLTADFWKIGLLGVMITLTVGGVVFLRQTPRSLYTVLAPISRKLPAGIDQRITRYTELIGEGLSVVRNNNMVSWVLILTITVWLLETASTYLMLYAFHITATPFMAVLLVTVLNLSFVFPITPGNIGINQTISIFLLGTFDVIPSSALAYSIGAQSTTYLLIVSLGMICLYREGMTLNLLRQKSQNETLGRPTLR